MVFGDGCVVSENILPSVIPGIVVGENVSFVIPIYNDGKYPLKISKIFTSCSCLSLIDHTKEFVVSPKDSVMVRFNFRSEESGEVTRDVFITSNSINRPILYVKILAVIY